MTTLIISLASFFIIFILGLLIANTYNNFQNYIIRINEAEANIDSTLRTRFDLLNKSIDIIKANTKIEGDILTIIVKLRSRKLSNFDLDRQLYEAIKEFNKHKEEHPELKKSEVFTRIDISLSESEAEIVAFRKYYNDIITDYNKLVKRFPSNIIALIFKFKTKLYFDGKDMSDDDTKDFKL
ncbi:MAG: LemA family protein [Bacilli bacterium]|nr:LemA family protein [Bacilli bacterium]